MIELKEKRCRSVGDNREKWDSLDIFELKKNEFSYTVGDEIGEI